jgi:AcrR family transcriptional regulator
MAESNCEVLDPRIRRTRQLLHQAMESLLKVKEFEKISVQDIADAATVNRATFYDHYPDKSALLECMVGSRFHELLAERDVRFDATCGSALKAITLAVCDYLAGTPGLEGETQRRLEPVMEWAIIAVVRRTILEGLKRHPPPGDISPEMIAATTSWAIYGAAKEWVRTPDRCPSDEIVETVTRLVVPILSATYGEPHPTSH